MNRTDIEDALEQALRETSDYARDGGSERAEFSAVLLSNVDYFGVPCELECSFCIDIHPSDGGMRLMTKTCIASISPASGGRCYGQGLMQSADDFNAPTNEFDAWEAWEIAVADASQQLGSDEAFQLERANREAAELAAVAERPSSRRRAQL